MNKSKNFSGLPVIKQVLNFLDPIIIYQTAKKYNSDRYCKTFKTHDHLVTLLFATISCVSSLRELSSIMLACEGKINHLNLNSFPKCSTISDANKRRSSDVFADIYYRIHDRYKGFFIGQQHQYTCSERAEDC